MGPPFPGMAGDEWVEADSARPSRGDLSVDVGLPRGTPESTPSILRAAGSVPHSAAKESDVLKPLPPTDERMGGVSAAWVGWGGLG